jgi:hypothetical protein
VDTEQAKVVLQHYRPTVDAEDPQFTEAVALARRDPELARWLAEHCAGYDAMRRTLRQTPVPAGLREEILQAYAASRAAAWWTRPTWVATLIVAALVLNVIGYILYSYQPLVAPPHDFAAYLQAMTAVAAGDYKLAIETKAADELRRYLASQSSPTDYTLTPGLRALDLEGGLTLEWFGRKVSMICFNKGGKEPQGQEANEDDDVWFFVVSRDALPDEPTSETPRFARTNGLITASWSRGDNAYVLATRGEQADLESLL